MITQKTKIFAVSAFLIFLGSIVGISFIGQYVQSKGEELKKQTKEIADFDARDQSYKELEKLVVSTQSDRDELDTYVLTEDETIDFLALIEQTAKKQLVELSTDSLKVTEEKGLFDTLVISYTVEGQKERVLSMLSLLETLPYHAFISNVSLQYTNEEGVEKARGRVELTVSLLNYDR